MSSEAPTRDRRPRNAEHLHVVQAGPTPPTTPGPELDPAPGTDAPRPKYVELLNMWFNFAGCAVPNPGTRPPRFRPFRPSFRRPKFQHYRSTRASPSPSLRLEFSLGLPILQHVAPKSNTHAPVNIYQSHAPTAPNLHRPHHYIYIYIFTKYIFISQAMHPEAVVILMIIAPRSREDPGEVEVEATFFELQTLTARFDEQLDIAAPFRDHGSLPNSGVGIESMQFTGPHLGKKLAAFN